MPLPTKSAVPVVPVVPETASAEVLTQVAAGAAVVNAEDLPPIAPAIIPEESGVAETTKVTLSGRCFVLFFGARNFLYKDGTRALITEDVRGAVVYPQTSEQLEECVELQGKVMKELGV